MSVSNDIRALAREGLGTAEIARRLGIRYQHAYNVLKTDGELSSPLKGEPKSGHQLLQQKPPLPVDRLIAGGFTFSGRWMLSATNDLAVDQALPKGIGVYAFVKSGIALYVGVATMGIAKRLYFYARPGISQRTSLRLNTLIKNELQTIPAIDIYVAEPPDFEWNDLPIHGSAGLELGLIKKFALPWNMRSAG